MTKKGRSKRKAEVKVANARTEGAWKKVDVELEAPTADTNHYDDDDDDDANHHHQKKSSNNGRYHPERELEAQPGEEVAMFYGLEVLDSSQYCVETVDGVRRMKILTDVKEVEDAANNSDPPRKKLKKSKLKKTEKSQEEDKEADVDEQHQDDPPDHQDADDQQDSDKPRAISKEVEKFGLEAGKSKKKKKKKKKKDKPATNDDDVETNDTADEQIHLEQSQIDSIQTSWCQATGGVMLHPVLCHALHTQSFWTPTPIQAAALPAAILGRRNVVGAAPTGSGKTLAFLLPVAQYLLELAEQDGERGGHLPLQALILTPTRELALQIHVECKKLFVHSKQWKSNKIIGSIVGGLAHAKQVRVLDQDRPPILVGTVGRLWELLSSRNHPHLNDLSQLRFLIIDETDRMLQQGGFPQLSRILDAVQQANPMDDSDDEDDVDADEFVVDDPDRLLSLPGIRGEARVKMLTDDILQQIQEQQNTEVVEAPEIEEDESEGIEEADEVADQSDDEISLPLPPPVDRQTFIFSATLTLPQSALFKSKKRKRANDGDVEGALAEILEKARAKGTTKVFDLSHNNSKKAVSKQKEPGEKKKEKDFNLPPGLKLQELKCTKLHKDSHLYAYLMTTTEGASGPCLVFCNSIAGVRRVGATLQTLKMQVRILHANMQQRARFKVVESLRQSTGRVVVVATDVAARGLDIPSVAIVVHYDGARNVGTFVHRSGRTARGVGEGAVGCSLSLVSSDEDKMHSRIVNELGVRFENVHLDGRLLNQAQERVNLASKVVIADELQSRTHREDAWFKEKADEVGVELDEDLLDNGGDLRDQCRLNEARKAKGQLQRLLNEPLQTQRYGKFLSTNSAAMHCLFGPRQQPSK